MLPDINIDETITTIAGETRHRTDVAAILPHNSPHANPRDKMFSATALDMPDAIRNFGSQFQIPNSHAV